MTAQTLAALHPAASQQTFRAVLEALARPAVPMALPSQPLDVLVPVIAPVLALADLSTGVCVLENAGDRWADAVATATSAPTWPAEMAKLVAAIRPVSDDEVRGFARGSAQAPEEAALVALSVRDVLGGPRRWTLSGPGIRGTACIAPKGLPTGFVAARADAVAAYPAGIDILLVTDDGRVVGLPRTTTITEEN
ncbi:phosphonate C-P lyase system protein PhnH [Mycobacterium sp. 1465703.0]|uniref:phosphonate C-P lyase system protein PhnH n=1 Tax=Mycobacterium sp. 1465703.0 TaxID=1834078 RepID=UPI0007FCB416|nr:phosphonate C-P lyase system protein PhnH [Mycobacterium sp. 1465703.0]OBJ03291.1 phosphonate C-P lyase system protein PhnH [Mycobacterium sp. 1465703.0]